MQAKLPFLMFVEFIDKPISGQFPEKHFGQVTPYAAWALFTSEDFGQWAGSFARGWEGFATLIITLEEQEKAFIVAGGDAYLIDVTKQQLLNKEDISGIKTAISDAERGRIIYSDGLYLHCIDFAGKISVLYDKNYFDDIELIEVKDNTLYARYWYYQRDSSPFTFEMNLVTNQVKDSYYDQVPDTSTNETNNSSAIDKLKRWFKID